MRVKARSRQGDGRSDTPDITRAGDLAPGSVVGRVLDSLPVAAAIVDERGVMVLANVALHELCGAPRGSLVGAPVANLVPEDQRRRHAELHRRYFEAPRRRPMGMGLAVRCRRADGAVFPADISLAPFVLGGRRLVVCAVRDDTERFRTEEELYRRATHDALTGLANRAFLVDLLDRALARRGERLTVLFVDLDGFKAVNDRHGHGVGDAVLCAVAEQLQSCVRPGDTLGRIGGDEFVVVCEPGPASDAAVRVAQRILKRLRRPLPIPGVAPQSIGASIGLAEAERNESAASLLERADRAMYAAKAAGGRSYRIAERRSSERRRVVIPPA